MNIDLLRKVLFLISIFVFLPNFLNANNDFKYFAPENLNWGKVTSRAPWRPRDSGEAFVFKDKIWLIGGLNANTYVIRKNKKIVVEYQKAPHFNDIWNTEDGIHWKKVLNKASWPPRRSMSVVFFKDKLWMLGGWSPSNGYQSDIWQSTDGIHWQKIVSKAPWPAREGQTVEVFKDKIWLIGGVNYNQRKVFNDVWYSEDGINWYEVKDIPWQPRWDHATEVFKDKLFLTGGMNLSSKVFKDVWVTEDGINWELINNDPPWQSRQGHALISYKDYLWIIGRLDDSENKGKNDVWFSKDGLQWQKTKEDPRWLGREDFFSVVFKDKIWIFGGMDKNWRWRNDVWVSD
jgi:hypothetical protein